MRFYKLRKQRESCLGASFFYIGAARLVIDTFAIKRIICYKRVGGEGPRCAGARLIIVVYTFIVAHHDSRLPDSLIDSEA